MVKWALKADGKYEGIDGEMTKDINRANLYGSRQKARKYKFTGDKVVKVFITIKEA